MLLFMTIVLFHNLSYNLRRLKLYYRNPLVEAANPENEKEIYDIFSQNHYNPTIYSLIDYHGQLQTSVQYFVRNLGVLLLFPFGSLKFKYKRELITLSDGGVIALDWAVLLNPRENTDNFPLVLIHHGLVGSSMSEYVIYQVKKLLEANFRVVVMNARGCGGVPLTTKQTFGGEKTQDMREVVKYLYENNKELFLIGFSLGGATVLRYVGVEGLNTPVKAVACVSPPWNLEIPTKVFSMWSFLLALPLKYYIYTHRDILGADSDTSIWDVLKCVGLDDLDIILHKSFGYNSVEEYRRHVSPVYVADNIMKPTLVISAYDDPVCSITALPDKDKRGPGLNIIVTNFGGHLAFPVGMFPWNTTSWTEKVIVKWFQLQSLK